MGLQSGVLAAVSLVLWPIGDDKQLVGEGLGSLYRAGVNGGSAPCCLLRTMFVHSIFIHQTLMARDKSMNEM